MGTLKDILKKFYRLRMKFSNHTGMGISAESNEKKIKAPVAFYKLEAQTNNGKRVSFEKFTNKKVLLVNLAIKCGFTPQYDELQELQQLHNVKIIILGFPSNDFGSQEPGSDEDIAEICKINFGVTFQLFHKDHVKGVDKQPVYQWLCDASKKFLRTSCSMF